MKIWQYILLVSIFIAIPILSACGPSEAELEYQEKLREAALEYQRKLRECEEAQRNAELEYQKRLRECEEARQAEQQARERKELEEVRNWCIAVAAIIEADETIIDSWNEFRDYSANITPYYPTDLKNEQEEGFFRHMELFETLNAQLSNLDCPDECYEANRVLRDYLQKRGPAIMDLILYFSSGQNHYRLTYNEKLVEINGLRQRYLDEFYKIIDEWDLWEDVSPYLQVPED